METEHLELGGGDFGTAGKAIRHAVFSNTVVWRTLGKCLNFGDLKACRLVCKYFNWKIMDETPFKSRALVKLQKEHLRPSPNGFRKTKQKSKKLSLPIFASDEEDTELLDLSWLYPLLEDVEHLVLRNELNNWESDPMPPYFEGVLKAPKKLRSLCVDPMLLSLTGVNIFQSCEAVLNGISELEITSSLGRPMSTLFLERQERSYEGLADTATNLCVFKASSVIPENLDSVFQEVDEDLMEKMKHILKIVEKNRAHLQVLELGDMPFWSTSSKSTFNSITKQVFPVLKKVKIRASQIEGKNLEGFLRALPPLEELDLTVLNQFPNDLLKVIRAKGERLKELKIKSKGFVKTENDMWKFLSTLNLQSFTLILVQSGQYSLNSEFTSSVLTNLPSSIRSIKLRGLPESGDWESYLTSADFTNINPRVLTVLNLSQCGNIITDNTVEFICRNLKMLQELNLSNTDQRVTDYGFTGIRHGSTASPEFSISDLKGMKSLKLRSCGAITNETLKRIRFIELRVLDVSNNRNLTYAGYMEVLKQNPSLEELVTSEDEGVPSEEELRKTICPRLQRHQFSDNWDSVDEDGSEHLRDLGSGGSGFGGDDMDDDYDDHFDDYDAYDADDYDGNSDDGWCFG